MGESDRGARVAFRVVLVVLLLVVAGTAAWVLGFGGGQATASADGPLVAERAAPGPAALPVMAESPDALSGWAGQVAAATGIPERAVLGYGRVDLAMRAGAPACHLGWTTLAGIGRVESDHGRYGGATLRPDGTESRPIVGVPLNGSPGVRNVPDTDHGRWDGDPVYDHAVGPLQFLPATWVQYANPGADPENIDAAALAAGRYLCAGGRDLATATGWWAAVLAYNNSTTYAAEVLGFADTYARASVSGSG